MTIGFQYRVLWLSWLAFSLSCATSAQGQPQLVAWGENNWGQINVPVGLTNVVQISAGSYHALVLLSDNSVVGWGSDGYGEIDIPQDLKAKQVAAGYFYSWILCTNGTLLAIGLDYTGQCDLPDGLTNVVSISVAETYGLALCADGTVVGVGDDSYGQCDIPDGLTNVVSVSAGQDHAAAICADGTIHMWGDNTYGECNVPAGLVGNILELCASSSYNIALRKDGTLVSWGDSAIYTFTIPKGLSNVVNVSVGGDQVMALTADGRIVVWGGTYITKPPDQFGVLKVPRGLGFMICSGAEFNVALINPAQLPPTTLAMSMAGGVPELTVTGASGTYSVYGTPDLSTPFSSLRGQVKVTNELPAVFYDYGATNQSGFYRTAYSGK